MSVKDFLNMKLAMIGVGKLGQDCAEIMAEKYDVLGYDPVPRTPSNFKMVNSIEEVVKDRDIIFIAVPTPHDNSYGGETPSCHLEPKDFDYSTVKNILSELNQYCNNSQLVVLISTVLPGTTRREFIPLIKNYRFIYNPYLIAMGSVKWDMVNPEMLIIGTEDGDVTGDAKILLDFYRSLMQNSPREVVGTWDEAESIKIFYNCYSEDTEVLTDKGWKLFSNAKDGDQVFALDPKTMIPDWIRPTKWVSRDWNGKMVNFHSKKDDILVTPGHNMLVGTQITSKDNLNGKKWGYSWTIKPAEEIIKKSGFVFQRSTNWHNDSPETVFIGSIEVPTRIYVQFMAWYLSEGCVSNDRVIISQDRDVNPEKYKMIQHVFGSLYNLNTDNTKYKLCESRTGISVIWKDLANELLVYGKSFDKFVPNTIKTLGRDMIRLFLDTYNLGDGSALHTTRFNGTREINKRYKHYATSSDKMAADLGELIIKAGRFPSYRTTSTDLSNKPCHLIYELVGKTSIYQRSSPVGLKFNTVEYVGKVYCAVLPKHHVFLTRRNGKCTWQGNTFISAKIGLVNMIQDVAEKVGHINVDVVTKALAESTHRITGPAYMTAGMGDAGACVLPNFKVIVNENSIDMESLYKKFHETKDGCFIVNSAKWSCSEIDQKKIHTVTRRKFAGKLIKITCKNGQLIATPDHLIPIERNGKRVIVKMSEIKPTDKLFRL